MPFELPARHQSVVTPALARFVEGHYDLIWYFGLRPWTLAGGLEPTPAVLDLVDLEDQKILARVAIPADARGGPVAAVRRRAARAWSVEEARRWGRLQRRAASRMVTTVVCSQLDRDRAVGGGMSRVSVIPNAYRRVDPTLGRSEVGRPPTILFQGTLRYPPNAEGARFLVDEVGPLLRAQVPGVRIRLVGRGAPALAGLGHPPEVTLVGQVPDIDVELARADLVVVPLRFGSGTRLKVLEAFAQRVPVVSTLLGAEGLDAEDGVHLLVGDTAPELAAACARLLSDLELRARLTEHAHQLFLARFQSDVVEAQVALLARRSSPGG
jgi:glycosyltransferase involved in cell wall biosynthesis